MKKYRVTLKTLYQVEAINSLEAENIARGQFLEDGPESLASTVAEVKLKTIVDESEGDSTES